MASSEHIRIDVGDGAVSGAFARPAGAFATRDELENVVERIGATAGGALIRPAPEEQWVVDSGAGGDSTSEELREIVI